MRRKKCARQLPMGYCLFSGRLQRTLAALSQGRRAPVHRGAKARSRRRNTGSRTQSIQRVATSPRVRRHGIGGSVVTWVSSLLSESFSSSAITCRSGLIHLRNADCAMAQAGTSVLRTVTRTAGAVAAEGPAGGTGSASGSSAVTSGSVTEVPVTDGAGNAAGAVTGVSACRPPARPWPSAARAAPTWRRASSRVPPTPRAGPGRGTGASARRGARTRG